MSDHQQGCKLQAPKKDPAPRQDFTSWVAYLHLGETESIRTHYMYSLVYTSFGAQK